MSLIKILILKKSTQYFVAARKDRSDPKYTLGRLIFL